MLEYLIPLAILVSLASSSDSKSSHRKRKNNHKKKSYRRNSRSNSRYDDPDWKALSYKEKDWY